jgi:hypothetical protein
MHFRPIKIDTLGIQTVQFDSEIRDEQGKPWLRIHESWFDLRLAGTTEVVFTPQTKTFKASHTDTTFIEMQFTKMPIDEFREWAVTFMSNAKIAASAADAARNAGAVDSEGQVSVVAFEGRFRSKEVEVVVAGNKMKSRIFIPGLEEEFEWHSWVVNSEHRAIWRKGKGPEFFSLG